MISNGSTGCTSPMQSLMVVGIEARLWKRWKSVACICYLWAHSRAQHSCEITWNSVLAELLVWSRRINLCISPKMVQPCSRVYVRSRLHTSNRDLHKSAVLSAPRRSGYSIQSLLKWWTPIGVANLNVYFVSTQQKTPQHKLIRYW